MGEDDKTRTQLRAELAELRQQNAVLVAEVARHQQAEDRRRHLEAQPPQSQKMDALGTLPGDVTHECNNILHIMLTYMSLAQTDIAPGHPALPHLHEIEVAIRRMKNLVQQMSDVSSQPRTSNILGSGTSHAMTPEEVQPPGIDASDLKSLIANNLSTPIQKVFARRILLIDDDDQFRNGLRQMLEIEGFEVVGAQDGRAGIRCYREAPVDVVITDLLMPVQEGVETIRELRHAFPEVKIIAMSGGAQGGKLDFLHVAQRLGALRTLRKPFSRDDLVLAIQEVLQA